MTLGVLLRVMLGALSACAAPPSATAGPASPPPVPAGPDAAFWAVWGDGNAEVSSYDLIQPRYGELHPGGAVLIFVTEDFSWSERVKADPSAHPATDIRKVIKLNATRDFQTGIYPYHVLTSTFLRLEAGDSMAALTAIKVNFSAQEWCGTVFDELTMAAGALHVVSHTYFDSDTRAALDLPIPAGTVYGDSVPVLIRGLEGPWLAPGQARTVPWLPTQMQQRFSHTSPALEEAVIRRAPAPESHTTPAGTYVVDRYTVAVTGGETTTWFVESAPPARIIGWSSTTGEQAALRGSDRLPYWQLNNRGDADARARVGL